MEREWDRRIQEFSQQQNKPYDYDDEALTSKVTLRVPTSEVSWKTVWHTCNVSSNK